MSKELTREEFQEIVHEDAGRDHVSGYGKKAIWKDTTELAVEWQTGGAYGGNCWGDEAKYSSESDPEPNFEDLDNILMKICPGIGLLQYREIEKLIQRSSRRQNDYYGNYTDFGVKTINVDELWRSLVDLGLVSEIVYPVQHKNKNTFSFKDSEIVCPVSNGDNKKTYYCEVACDQNSKQRQRFLAVSDSESDVQETHDLISVNIPDGYYVLVEDYDETNVNHQKARRKLTKKERQRYMGYLGWRSLF